MTFKKFEKLVKEHCPNVESMQPHGSGDFGGGNVGSVAVVFKNGHKRLYFYTGSYWSILQKLGADIVARSYLEFAHKQLEQAEKQNGKPMGLFGGIADTSNEIIYWQNKLTECATATIIEDE